MIYNNRNLVRINNDIEYLYKYGTQYTIEENDNLYEIAVRFNTSVKKLKELNKLKDNKLKPGQTIIVDNLYNPNNESIYQKYVVKKDDTIYSIAFNYGMTLDEVLEINSMLDPDIKEGDVIYVYNRLPLLNEEIIYTVKQGDSLYSIAKKYNTTVNKIKETNFLKSDNLKVGKKIIIIKEEKPTGELYTIMPGDTLYSLAIKNNTTVNEIKKANNLITNDLIIGQQIIIPKDDRYGKSK